MEIYYVLFTFKISKIYYSKNNFLIFRQKSPFFFGLFYS